MQQTQNNIDIKKLLEILHPGDIGLTANPQHLGKIIKWFQELEGGDEAIFTHAFIIGNITINSEENLIYESINKIGTYPLSKYINKHICIIRHNGMCYDKFLKGMEEVYDNLGMGYPYYRLLLIAIDTLTNHFLKKIRIFPKISSKFSSIVHFDRPVCSELVAQFFLKSGLKTYFDKGEKWTNINPDDIHDAALKHKDKYTIIFDGILRDYSGL